MGRAKLLIILVGIYSIIVLSIVSFVLFFSGQEFPANEAAIVLMMLSAIFVWVILLGSLMYKFRDRFKSFFQSLPGKWQIKFVIFATIFALLEEAVTTTMTNLAPLFGSKIGEAYITASTNYLHVVLFNSVIVFIPMFIAWSFLLSKYDFSAASVFLLYGLTGSLAEAMSFGASNLIGGFWFFIYGLMVYLPAYSIPKRDVKKPKFRHYILALFLPIIFAIPVAVVIEIIRKAIGIVMFTD
jgi:hypothetical protein